MESSLSKKSLAAYIEHTLLKPTTTRQEIEQHCKEAIQYGFFGVCVPPYYVATAKNCLKGKKVKIITVAGFPLGYSTLPVKAEAVKRAIADGADEVDVVINLAALKSGQWNHVRDEINSLATLCRLHGKIVKVIIETAVLEQSEMEEACQICAEAGVDFVKTSTGFTGGGATVEVVRFLRSILPEKIGVKASGGIKTLEEATAMIAAGASRIGTSSGINMMNQA